MRLFLALILMFIFVALQISLTPIISINGITPNLILIIVFLVAFSFGQTYGIWLGFFSGFLCDIYNKPHLGLNMGLFLIIGFVIGSLRTKFYKDNVIIEVIIFSITLFFYELIYTILLWQFSLKIFFFNILRYSIPSVFYSAFIALILFSLFKRIPVFATNH